MIYKKIIFSVLVSLMILLFISCASSTIGTEKEYYTPSYSWDPPETANQSDTNKITFSVIGANYATNANWVNISLFQRLVESISKNFEELMIAKGFNIKGPFRSYNEMTFPDKKGSDLGIMPDIELNMDLSRFTVRTKEPPLYSLSKKPLYYHKGTITLSGRVSIVVIEPITGEKMWTKVIDLQPMNVECSSTDATLEYPSGINFNDININNPLARAVEKYYNNILNTAWKYINNEEMQIARKQSLEVRSRKVYE